MPDNPIRVLIVDDHVLVRKGTRAFLAEIDDIYVIGDTGSGREAIQLVDRLNPDLILVDLMMPEMDGIQTIRQISSVNRNVRILVMTSFIAEERVVSALQAGAHNYLMKDSPPEKLSLMIQQTCRGESILQHGIAKKILEIFITNNADQLLTPIEVEILSSLTSGSSLPEIAKNLGFSEVELRKHVFLIIQKLHQFPDPG